MNPPLQRQGVVATHGQTVVPRDVAHSAGQDEVYVAVILRNGDDALGDEAVARRAQREQVVEVGGASVSPLGEVVHLDEPRVRAPRHGARAVPHHHQCVDLAVRS